jgi:hypothetical protein
VDLARAEGMLKFRNEIKRNDWLQKGYAWDEFFAEQMSVPLPLSDEEIYYAFIGDEDLFEGEGLVDGQWPVLYWDSLTGEADCSGVLIGPNHYLTAGHCLTGIYDRLAEGYAKYENFYYPAHGFEWPFIGATDEEKAEIMCGLTEVAFEFRVKWTDLPLVDKGFGILLPVTSIEDLEFLTDDDWRDVFRAARNRQQNFKCKNAYPVFFGASPMDYVVLELDGAPGFTHGWMDVSSEPPGLGTFHGVVVGHPSGCPQMLSLGTSPGVADPMEDLDILAYGTSGFSGSPTLFLETGKIEGSISQGLGTAEYFEACIDADVTSCQPQWIDNSQVYNCGDDIPGPGFNSFVDFYGSPQNRGFCVIRTSQTLHNLGTWYYFDQITELTLPDISLCTFQPESNYLWSKLCQHSPATTYEELQNLKPHLMFCDSGYPPPAGNPCPDPYPSNFPVADAYENNLHSGWHAASFSYKDPPEPTVASFGPPESFPPPPPPPDMETVDIQPEPWTIWSAGVNCFKKTTDYNEMVIDEDVETGSEDGFARVMVCKAPVLQALDKAGLAPIYIWDDDGPSVLGHNLDYQWKPTKEIWWEHNIGSQITEISDNNDSGYYMARFVTVAEYRRDYSWGVFSRPYEEEDGYFDDNTHSRTYFHQPGLIWDGPIWDYPGPDFAGYATGGTSKNTRYGFEAPDPVGVGLLDDSVPVLVQARSSSEPLSYEKCGYDRTGTPVDGNAQGATLAFLDPQRGRVFHEICANESADGTFPRGVNPAFEVLGWRGSEDVVEQFVVALYGGTLADGSVSDELWLGVVQTDVDGVPATLRWEKETPVEGTFRPPGLRDARLVQGYDGEGLYLFGGRSQGGAPGGLYQYRLASGLWEQIEMTGAVGGSAVADAAAVRHTNVVYVYGGVRPNGSLSNGLFALHLPSGFVERVADGLPGQPGRRGASLALSERTARIYLSGGFDGANGHNDVWSLPVGKPSLGWTLESEDCQGRNCPGGAGGVLLLDRSDDSPVVAASLSEGDPSLARSWKRTRTGWMFDRELGDRDLMTD